MTDERDELLERLRAANPVPDTATAGARDLPEADALYARITRRRPRPRRAILIAAVIALVLLLIATLAGFLLVRHEAPEKPETIACYATPDLHARAYLGTSADDPSSVCAAGWRAGALGKGPVPNFATCILDTGALAAFPGESGTTCQRLGLAVATPGVQSVGQFSVAADDAVNARCIPLAEARRVVEDELATYNLHGWSIDASEAATPDRPCSSLAIDASTRRVTLVPLEDRNASVPPTTTR